MAPAAAAAVRLAQRAHAKIILHACKFAAAPVNGVLLGRVDGAAVEIVDVVPLFHSHLSLPARLETALAQVHSHARLQDLVVIGYYQGGDSGQDDSHTKPDALARAIGAKIAEQAPHSFIILIDSREFKAPFNTCLQLWARNGDDWTSSTSALNQPDSDATTQLVRGNEYRRLVDFEDHLSDISKDWLDCSL